jgi:hypothetical protein
MWTLWVAQPTIVVMVVLLLLLSIKKKESILVQPTHHPPSYRVERLIANLDETCSVLRNVSGGLK